MRRPARSSRKSGDGSLDAAELKRCVRKDLKLKPTELSDVDIAALVHALLVLTTGALLHCAAVARDWHGAAACDPSRHARELLAP